MKDLKVKVLSNAPIASGIYRMEFALPEETEGMRCGKFLNISVGDGRASPSPSDRDLRI